MSWTELLKSVRGDLRNFIVCTLAASALLFIWSIAVAILKAIREEPIPWGILGAMTAFGIILIAVAIFKLQSKAGTVKRESVVSPTSTQPALVAYDALNALWIQGKNWLEKFSSQFPAEQEVNDWWEQALITAKLDSLKLTIPDIRLLNEPLDGTDVIRRAAEVADQGEQLWMFDVARMGVFTKLCEGVSKLERLILKLEGLTLLG